MQHLGKEGLTQLMIIKCRLEHMERGDSLGFAVEEVWPSMSTVG
jgi:hypothetical protein